MIIGKINKNDKVQRFDSDICCTNCKKKVPGGLKTSKKFYETKEFKKELEDFKKEYLCGICRDRKRTQKKNQS